MKIIILLLIVLILVFLYFCNQKYMNKENFSSLDILEYPDPHIEKHDKWLKEHVNDTIKKKKIVYNFLALLGKDLNTLFYSTNFSNIIQRHNNLRFDERVPFIINTIIDRLNILTNENHVNYQEFSNSLNNEVLQILKKYLLCNTVRNTQYQSNNSASSSSLSSVDSAEQDQCTDIDRQRFTEPETTKLHFDRNKFKKYDLANDVHLIHKYFVSRDLTNLLHIFKKKLMKHYIFEHNQYKSQDYIPCVIYDTHSCPSTGGNSKCDVIDNLCVPRVNGNDKNVNNNQIEDCNAISNYGANLCNRTTNKQNQDCIWNENTHTCRNPTQENDPVECIDIKGENFEDKCISLENSSGGLKCDYFSKEVTDSDGNRHNYEFCYDKDLNKKNNMTCLNLSGILDDSNPTDRSLLEKYNCDTKIMKNTKYYYDPDFMDEEKVTNLECGIFDNSDYLRDKNNSYNFKKDTDRKYLGNNVDLQKKLCENNTETQAENSPRRCNFIKYNTFDNNTISKCMSKEILMSPNFINDDDEDTCRMLGYDYIGTQGNKKCIDIGAKCNDIKYKNLCDMRNNKCMWIEGYGYNSNSTNDLNERGYCVNQDLSELDNLIDDYHNEEISQIAKFRNLSNELAKINTNEDILNKLKQKLN